MFCVLSLLCVTVLAAAAAGQITPSDDSYTLTSTPTVNFGAKTLLEVESAGATTFVRFDLSGIPPTVTASVNTCIGSDINIVFYNNPAQDRKSVV